MAIFKCKMCGGTIEFEHGATVGICDSCGTKQTLPKTNDDVIANLHNRANTLRIKCEFDKAEEIYNKILENDPGDPEAHWGIILCKYGSEYVEDPKTYIRVPTCHRTSFEAILADEDYKAAIANGDVAQRELYEAEAKQIDRIQKDILSIVKNEKPFDVFICYKETDENGKRTQDSAIANDIYYQLTQEGFKVFYAAITLEDKLGQEYEPYIFAALNSAKVMLVVGSKPEYFTAVWVKNEWSRFLKLMKTDRSKLLIPCYKDIDAYDLPEEFAHLQAQDMSKIGFINDLVRGIKKVASGASSENAPKESAATSIPSAGTSIAPLLERVVLFLEDGKWQDANIYCEKVLDIDPKNAEAYLGKLMSELQVKNRKQLADCAEPFDERDNYSKVLRFGDMVLGDELRGYITHINERNENTRLTGIYNNAKNVMIAANTERAFKAAADTFATIPGFKDADALAEQCRKKARVCSKDAIYASAKNKMIGENAASYKDAIEIFQKLSGWKDADEQIYACQKKIEEIKAKEEANRVVREKNEKKRKKAFAIGTPIVAVCIALVIVLTMVIIPKQKFNKAMVMLDSGDYESAYALLEEIGNSEAIASNKYDRAMKLIDSGDYESAYMLLNNLAYKDSKDKASECLFLLQKSNLTDIKKGDTVKFGFYEQDNDTANGREEIEWVVLNVEDGKALVISKYALDRQQYDTSFADVTWEKCTLRKWLNDSFLNTAFTAKHQELIPSVSVSADKNPYYSTNPGNATTDKVFLLSITEAEKYFTTDESRECAPTAYDSSQASYTVIGNCCTWWLRSPGDYQKCAAYVDYDGSVCYSGYLASTKGSGCVRPALWITLD